MIRHTIKPEQMGRFEKVMGVQLRPALKKACLSAAQASVTIMQERTRAARPANPGNVGTGGAVNTGAYLRAWRARRHPLGAVLYNSKSYAGVIELGRRPGGRLPPFEPILSWARRRITVTTASGRSRRLRATSREGEVSELFRVAHAIQWSIATHGLVGRRIMTARVARLRMAARLRIEIVREVTLAFGRAAGQAVRGAVGRIPVGSSSGPISTTGGGGWTAT